MTKRYNDAQAVCKSRGVEALLAKLEAVAEKSRPVIAMSFSACDDILRADKYRNYHQRIESGERDPANAGDHSDREIVGARLFPMYNDHIHYAALSPDGRGLSNYGPVAVRWEVTPTYIGRRASLLEMNSYTFFDHHSLGRRGATIPPGYRAIWDDRANLAAAKIAPRLTPATGEGALPGFMLQSGKTLKDDDFIEVAIYADKGLDTRDVDMVTLQRSAMTPEEAHRRELVRGICSDRGITFVE